MEKHTRSGGANHQHEHIIRPTSMPIADLSRTSVYEVCKIKKDLEDLIDPESFAMYSRVMNQ